MNFPKIKNIIVLVVIFFGVIVVAKPFTAEALTVSPVRVEISGNPGQVLEEKMTLINDTKNSQTFYSSFLNFEAEGETGNPAFVESSSDLDKWMSTENSITIEPGKSVIATIKIAIPQNAEPGGHFAAVFWGTFPNNPENPAVSIGAKVGMLILLSVNGDVEEGGGLLQFSTIGNKFWYNTLPVSFMYRFKNDGGDRIKPTGKTIIRNTFFIPTDKIDANISKGNILPNSIRKFEFDWIKSPRAKDFIAPEKVLSRFFDTALYQFKNFAVGLYSAKLDLTYGIQNLNTTKTVYFFVFPWQMLLCLAVILSIVLFVGSKLVKRYNRYIIQKARVGMTPPNDANHV
ncbi:MAG TPA: hypothetical protein PKZ36_00450 [Candidatus Paceibacterota bacterium]|nr:hypothetical protein [Candidatus Paceibacterota bacterium]HPT17869.1 hypothetical protein [Candidatus Paceibacterota bacterium]